MIWFNSSFSGIMFNDVRNVSGQHPPAMDCITLFVRRVCSKLALTIQAKVEPPG
ncbi:hypothetical protein WJE34_000156 [Escherichia coli]